MRAALDVEALRLRRSGVARVAAAVLVLIVPMAAAGLIAAARSDADGVLAAKVRPMIQGTGWEAYLGMVAQD